MIDKAMEPGDTIDEFTDFFARSLQEGDFAKATLRHYKGDEPDLKSIAIRKILVKGEEKLSFTYRYQTRDIVKNYPAAESIDLVSDFLRNGFLVATLFTGGFDLHLEKGKKGPFLRKEKASQEIPSDLSHNRQKNYAVDETRPYLHALGVTNEKGFVNKHSQDKFRQINKYIEILDGLIGSWPQDKEIHIADMGAGKGYLTFALHDYLSYVLKKMPYTTGVEYRADMVDLCNRIAKKEGMKNLSFVQNTIDGYHADTINVLIALHACDTATDDAIAKGIIADADLIVVAPCCHKQIRREMELGKTPEDLSFLLKHGIFMERQAEMATDALRALILEQHGYTTKVFEFISDSHTPKNVMITAVKTKKNEDQSNAAKIQVAKAKEFLGIKTHYLEKLLNR